MTTIFLEINNDFYLLEHLTYKSETNVFTVLTESFDEWKKDHHKCPEESEHYFFILLQANTRKHEEYKQNFRVKNS